MTSRLVEDACTTAAPDYGCWRVPVSAHQAMKEEVLRQVQDTDTSSGPSKEARRFTQPPNSDRFLQCPLKNQKNLNVHHPAEMAASPHCSSADAGVEAREESSNRYLSVRGNSWSYTVCCEDTEGKTLLLRTSVPFRAGDREVT